MDDANLQNESNTNTIEPPESKPANADTVSPNTEPAANDQTVVELQQMMVKSREQPTLQDVLNKKTTWKEFFDVYNVLRIFIAAAIAILIWLTLVGIAHLLNPNTCKHQRTVTHRLQYNPIANMIVVAWFFILITIPMVRIFGHELLWSIKKINYLTLTVVVLLLVFFIVYGFITNVYFSLYLVCFATPAVAVALVYIFVTQGYYFVWLLFPFVILFFLCGAWVGGSSYLFTHIVKPPTPSEPSPFFGFTYNVILTLFETIILYIPYIVFPYKWGKRFTCPCRKNAVRQPHNPDGDQVTVENELSDVFLFYYSMVFGTFLECQRVVAFVTAKDVRWGFDGWISLIVFGCISEALSRNGLYSEFTYRCILKKESPPWTRLYRIWYGAKYFAGFIPIWTVLLMTFFKFGPFLHCGRVRDAELAPTVNIDGDYWLFVVMMIAELSSDLCSVFVARVGRYFKWFGVCEKDEVPPRQTILVKVNLVPQIWIHVHCYVMALLAFYIDNKNRSDEDVSFFGM